MIEIASRVEELGLRTPAARDRRGASHHFDHLHFDRRARVWRSHAELVEDRHGAPAGARLAAVGGCE